MLIASHAQVNKNKKRVKRGVRIILHRLAASSLVRLLAGKEQWKPLTVVSKRVEGVWCATLSCQALRHCPRCWTPPLVSLKSYLWHWLWLFCAFSTYAALSRSQRSQKRAKTAKLLPFGQGLFPCYAPQEQASKTRLLIRITR